MGEASGIGPWTGGSEAEVLIGEDKIAATDQITTEGGHCPATGAMSGAGKVRVFSCNAEAQTGHFYSAANQPKRPRSAFRFARGRKACFELF